MNAILSNKWSQFDWMFEIAAYAMQWYCFGCVCVCFFLYIVYCKLSKNCSLDQETHLSFYCYKMVDKIFINENWEYWASDRLQQSTSFFLLFFDVFFHVFYICKCCVCVNAPFFSFFYMTYRRFVRFEEFVMVEHLNMHKHKCAPLVSSTVAFLFHISTHFVYINTYIHIGYYILFRKVIW